MIAGLSSHRVRRILAAVVPLIAALWLSGCEYDTYPKDLEYPLRDDPIVINAPKNETPFYPPGPGHLDEEIAAIPKLGGEILDPNKVSKKHRDLHCVHLAEPRFWDAAPSARRRRRRRRPEIVTQLVDLKIRDAEGKTPSRRWPSAARSIAITASTVTA